MKIFGIKFATKKELKKNIAELNTQIKAMKNVFPFEMGQIVYDVQLRNEHGRYAKKNASLEHSLINEIIVDKKNYFSLVERYKRHDVFTSRELAQIHLKKICTK